MILVGVPAEYLLTHDIGRDTKEEEILIGSRH